MLDKNEVLEELERLGNYIVKLKEILDKVLKVNKKSTLLEFNKYLDIIVERLYSIFNKILPMPYFEDGMTEEDLLFKRLDTSYILSNKSIEKFHFVNKIYKKILKEENYKRSINKEELNKVIDYLDDIIDELNQYISIEK